MELPLSRPRVLTCTHRDVRGIERAQKYPLVQLEHVLARVYWMDGELKERKGLRRSQLAITKMCVTVGISHLRMMIIISWV